MFTPTVRARLRGELIEAARADGEVVGAALVGSAATGREDAWSDIDLVLQVRSGVEPEEVADRWTVAFYERHGAAHHLDVVAGGVLYRVFLLASSLQVDVSFWPEDRFRATEPGFAVLFGEPQPSSEPAGLDVSQEVGKAWLYALHSRSAIARGRMWQATMMLDHLRDQLLVLACLRHGLNPHHGREADRLPPSVLDALRHARATTMALPELSRSHQALVRTLIDEVALYDHGLFAKLNAPLGVLSRFDA
ncbi:nucleotidyltransferase domain-containing protein [Nocardiopsis alba]|uniref:nucleotidyltransferase domain-containing protein n=1 Tax=Nocardiopsis alba TaxID=53437 RepID=UPI0033A06066